MKFWERFKNPGVVVSIVSLILLILATNGIQVDNERVLTTVKAICSIGVILGVMNNPETPGLDLPFINKTKNK